MFNNNRESVANPDLILWLDEPGALGSRIPRVSVDPNHSSATTWVVTCDLAPCSFPRLTASAVIVNVCG